MIVRPLIQREVHDAVRRYWFLVNAGVFAVAGLVLMMFGQADVVVLGYRGFGRALAGLLQLSLVVVPLMAMVPALIAIAGERDAGTLEYVLSQPLVRSEVFVSKWIGVTAAVVASLVAGFAIAGIVAAVRGVPGTMIAALVGLTLLLALAFVSIGLLISTLVNSQTRATSLGLTAWLVLLALGTLGVVSAFIHWGFPGWALQAWALVNPIEAYRIAGTTVLDPDPTSLGSIGAALFDRFGRSGLIALSAASMMLWAAGAGAAGLVRFSTALETRASRRSRPAP